MLPGGWSDALNNGDILSGVPESKFNDPSLRLSNGGQQGVGGFVNGVDDSQDCKGKTTVTYDPVTSKWTLSK